MPSIRKGLSHAQDQSVDGAETMSLPTVTLNNVVPSTSEPVSHGSFLTCASCWDEGLGEGSACAGNHMILLYGNIELRLMLRLTLLPRHRYHSSLTVSVQRGCCPMLSMPLRPKSINRCPSRSPKTWAAVSQKTSSCTEAEGSLFARQKVSLNDPIVSRLVLYYLW